MLSCLALVCAAQRTSGWGACAAACAAVVSVVAASGEGRARLWWIARRTRVLFCAVFLLYGYSGGGPALVPMLGGWSPTVDGILAGGEQAARLAAAIALSVRFFAGASRDELISGLYALALPLSAAGFPAARVAVRIALMLRYAESLKLSSPRRWLEELSGGCPPVEPGTVTVYRVPLGALDWAVLAGSAGLWLVVLAR